MTITDETPITLIGHRFAPGAHELRDFVARNRIPAVWVDATEKDRLTVANGPEIDLDRLPAAILPDGRVLHQPTTADLADCVGALNPPACEHYDLVIVGGGPAGLAGAIYASSEGLRTVVIERNAPGGQAGQSSRIENYMGFPEGVSGGDLADSAAKQAARLGSETVLVRNVVDLKAEGAARVTTLDDGTTITSAAVLLSMGINYRRHPAEGFDRLLGRGIFYGAAITEAHACKEHDVAIIGAGNSAGQAAVYLSQFARKVTILVRNVKGLEGSMSHYLIEQIDAIDNVEVCVGCEVTGAWGDDCLEGLMIQPLQRSIGELRLPVEACFVFIGAVPETDWLDGILERDDHGFIRSGISVGESWPLMRKPLSLETSLPGVFVAGDVRARSMKRVAAAVGEGCQSIAEIHQYLSTNR